ncbi:MAG: hypothetical protein ACFE9I_11970 [Candidatus Hermodarchaeota archaeon]
MDILRFNKELGTKIAKAKGFEKNGNIKAAIRVWLEVSEMALNFSKSRNIEPSFKNMILNRTKGIFEHIKNLKSGNIDEEEYQKVLEAPNDASQIENSFEEMQNDKSSLENEANNEKFVLKSKSKGNGKNIDDAELKGLPNGFKEIKASKDFNIVTPHDKNFVKKHFNKMEESEIFKSKKQENINENFRPQERYNFEEPEDSKALICFACGYDKNLVTDKICKNCGTPLN